MQTCLTCGTEREALVQFDGPHYRRTQESEKGTGPTDWARELELMRTRKRGD
jgi:hypothetical protein